MTAPGTPESSFSQAPEYLLALDFEPIVVLFGEEIPALPSWSVKRALRDCDLFIAIGTSGLVTPAANYVRGAEYAGARTILVNLEPMAQPNPAFKEQYLGPAETVLPELLATGALPSAPA